MPHNRFFTPALFKTDEEILLEGDEAYHVQRVMRKKENDIVELINGCNQLAYAKILKSEKKGIRLIIFKVEDKNTTSFKMIICQAIPRANRLDLIVEKGTELGMGELWLFPAELSEKKEVSHTQIKRLESIATSAMKQCGRFDLPKILLKPPLSIWDKVPYPAYFGDPSHLSPPFLSSLHTKENVLFFIGPEAGFTSAEERHLKKLGAQGVILHPNILRTETASLVALSLFSSR